MVILEVALLRLKFLLQLKSISALHKRNEVVYLVFHKLSHSILYCHHHLPFSIFFYHHCYSCRLNFRKMIACLCNVFHQVTLRWFTCNIFQLSFDWLFSFFLSFFSMFSTTFLELFFSCLLGILISTSRNFPVF